MTLLQEDALVFLTWKVPNIDDFLIIHIGKDPWLCERLECAVHLNRTIPLSFKCLDSLITFSAEFHVGRMHKLPYFGVQIPIALGSFIKLEDEARTETGGQCVLLVLPISI